LKMDKGKRYDGDSKFNLKKVFGVIVAFLVIIIVILSMVKLLSEDKKSKEILAKEIESKLNEGHNFVDYFLTIGSNPSIFKNNWLYESDISTLNTKYQESIKPIMINRFPSKDKAILGFDDGIIYHCFPEGFKVYEFNKQPEYKIFSILLDNNNYSINYPFKYVVCLKFFESINQYKKLYDKYNELSNKYAQRH